MVDNQHNDYHTAPDKGSHHGPVWRYSGSLDQYMTNLRDGFVVRGGFAANNGTKRTPLNATAAKSKRADESFWLSTLGSLGAVRSSSPLC